MCRRSNPSSGIAGEHDIFDCITLLCVMRYECTTAFHTCQIACTFCKSDVMPLFYAKLATFLDHEVELKVW